MVEGSLPVRIGVQNEWNSELVHRMDGLTWFVTLQLLEQMKSKGSVRGGVISQVTTIYLLSYLPSLFLFGLSNDESHYENYNTQNSQGCPTRHLWIPTNNDTSRFQYPHF